MTDHSDHRLIEALQTLETKLDAMARVAAQTSLRTDASSSRLETGAGFSTRRDVAEAVNTMASRANRIEDEICRVREVLTAKIDRLAEMIAGFTPRLMNVEAALTELRAGMAGHDQVGGLETRLSELSARVDQTDESNNARTSGLSTQINAWLVSLIGLVVGALVAYSLLGHH